jgi:anti-anti-sigma factor
LVVVRSEDESGRVGLRLIGELDLNTVGLLAEELENTREHSPPSVIDLSELRFLDLAGLDMLQRTATSQDGVSARLVGATGIVRRMIELAHVLDAQSAGALGQPLASEPTTRVAAQQHEASSRPPAGHGRGTRRSVESLHHARPSPAATRR